MSNRRKTKKKSAENGAQPEEPQARPQSVLRWTFRAFAWIDDSLQNLLHERGWPRGSHTQSMILLAVGEGITRPSGLARYLGVSRQAIHQALASLIERRVLELREDPEDGRSKIVQFSPDAARVTQDVMDVLALIEKEIAARVGQSTYRAMIRGLSTDWGDPLGGEGGLKTPRMPRRGR